ncbi:GDSL-type esterase/lipase family protein [Actinacidiphila glaucinigra]|uniref:GDSL-type esterase/lipase family protein n=1 Tax=Actinacidiphila glaucinigra TaxID=235986 RepID=UPI003718DBA9
MTTATHSLRAVPLTGGPVEIRGALDLERTRAGLLPRRLPAWTRSQYPDVFMDETAALPSGVRLAFRTAARVVELELLTSVWQLAGTSEPLPAGVVDLVVDGRRAGSAPAPPGDVLHKPDLFAEPSRREAGAPGRVRFDGLPGAEKDVELWLPQQTRTELVGLWADAEVLPPRPTGRRRWIHHGSSISHCAAAESPTATWPALAAALAGAELLNLGLGGNAMLDPYVARTIRDLPADLISLKLGINIVNRDAFRLRSFGPAVHGFLDTVRDGHPDVPLLVVSPISCPVVETTPGPTAPDLSAAVPRVVAMGSPADVPCGALTLTVIRAELARIVAARAASGDRNLHYLDGRRLFGPGDVADLPDDLHPNAAGYRRMGRRFAALAFGPRGPFAERRRSGPDTVSPR